MDKNKIIEGAAKLVAKGAYDKAIKEYQKVLDSDPKDVRILQKMGELYQKKNDNAQAAQYFKRVAESYSTDGFFLKAVALYKQVLKLNPNLADVNIRLAELHQQLGLMSEAMSYYQTVATHYDKSGDVKSSLDTLRKMVDLDPENVASRIKLAELYARENMNKEAGTEFHRAAEYLRKHNRGDDYLRVAERISQLEPDNLQLARELAAGYLQRGDQKRALAKLQVCFKANPREVETLNLLSQAFQGLGQQSKTLSVLKELAKIHGEEGREHDVQRTWDRISQVDPNDPDLLARRGGGAPPSRSVPAPAPAPAPAAPARAAPVYAPPPPSHAAPAPAPAAAPAAVARPAPSGPPNPLAKLLTETDVYVKYGLHDKALEHLRKIFAVDPENLDAHEKAYQIYVAARNASQASEQLLNVLRLCTRRNEVDRGQSYLDTLLEENPGHPEVPAFLSVLRPGAPVPEVGGDDEAILVDTREDEIVVSDAPPDALADVDPAELARLTARRDQASDDDGEALVVEDESSDSDGQVIELDGSGDTAALDDEPLLGAAPQTARSDDEPMGEELVVEELSSGEVQVADDDEAALAAAGDSGGEEVIEDETLDGGGGAHASAAEAFEATQRADADDDLALVQDDAGEEAIVEDPALDPAEAELSLDAASPSPPGVTGDWELGQAHAAADEEAVEVPLYSAETQVPDSDWSGVNGSAESPVAHADEEAAVAPPEEEPAAEECDEASFFIDQGLHEEAREILETILIAYPGHARATELLGRLDVAEASGETTLPDSETSASASAEVPSVAPVGEGGTDAFDLAAELADELGDASAEAPAPLAAAGDEFQYSVEEVFSEFKKGLQKVVKPEDVDTHYDLGIAYKEMGLSDDAIGEFQVALEGCRGKKKEIDCLSMLAILHSGRGDHAAAIEANKQALASAHATPDVAKALGYEIAVAWEALGQPGKALFHYQRVAAQDRGYRDAASKAERLGQMCAPEEDGGGTDALGDLL